MSIFGWSLPPGCTTRHIEDAYGAESVCDLCGVGVDACDCPECPTCGEVGVVECLDDHGTRLTPEQIRAGWAFIGKQAQMDAMWEAYANADD